MDERKIVVVLTLGRSGSSLLTRGLKALGVDLGDRFWNGVEGINPTGFWEDIDIGRINDDILYELQTHLGGISIITREKIENFVSESTRNRAVSLLKDKVKNRKIFGLKDVHFCHLLCFWKPIFDSLPLKTIYIIAVRNPIDVAHSRKNIHRNIFYEEKSYLQWLQYNTTLMLETEGENRIVVDYDNLVERPTNELRRIATAIGIQPSKIDQTSISDYTDTFIDKNLRHRKLESMSNSPEPIPFAPKLIRKTYEILEDLAADRASTNSPKIIDFFNNTAAKLEQVFPSIQAIHDLEVSLSETRIMLEKAIVREIANASLSWE